MIIKDMHDTNLLHDRTRESAALLYQNGMPQSKKVLREVVSEHTIAVYVNDQLTAQLVCTPADFAELVTGRLLTEQIIYSIDEVREVYICEKASRARVFLKDTKKVLQSFVEQSPTCCSDNHVYLQAKESVDLRSVPRALWSPEQIFGAASQIRKGSQIYQKTHGTHGGFLIQKDRLVYQCEDIGRHNAIDKVIGYLAIHKIDPGECMIYSTGRASADMVRKAVRMQIPVFLSKAAPTYAAIDLARTYGLTLISNIKAECFEVFSS